LAQRFRAGVELIAVVKLDVEIAVGVSLTIGLRHYFFAVSVCCFFSGSAAKPARHKNWGQTEMTRRQKETSYLREVLRWLQQYWTD
jgi:hypothetical protein